MELTEWTLTENDPSVTVNVGDTLNFIVNAADILYFENGTRRNRKSN